MWYDVGMKTKTEEKTLNLLLSGKHPKSKKFAGHHVLVIKDEVFPLRDGEKANEDMDRLEKKHGRSPIIAFVPRQDITYILFSCEK